MTDLNTPRADALVMAGEWEALQRLIEDAMLRGPASREDAATLRRWRGELLQRDEQHERDLAARDAAMKNAQRYLWLRAEIGRVDPMISCVAKAHYDRQSSDWCNFANAETLDAAIDQAREGK